LKAGDHDSKELVLANVLVVDDGALITSWLTEILRREGYDVEIARDEKQALRMYKSHLHQLIITDLRLPDGVEMMAELLHRSPFAQILAIVGGELVQPDSVLNTASIFGSVRILRKPFSLTTFLKTVQEQLAQGIDGA
jgi:CheY-like chemotaxis protein